MAIEPDKGGRAEEFLRAYFLRSGFFVVRGLSVQFRSAEVTDIDLWLYARTSTLSRTRVNVDAKYKTTPKALERIFWAKGVQVSLGFEQAIVATADKRPIVKDCGAQYGIQVLDGSFLGRLMRAEVSDARLTEEAFVDLFVSNKEDRLLGHWKKRFEDAKSRLATQLEFDGCNTWLEDSRYFLEQALTSERSVAACRLYYLMVAFFLVGLDYSIRPLFTEDGETRKAILLDGFRFGTRGRKGTEDIVRAATGLIESYAPEFRSRGSRVRVKVLQDLDELPVDILAEFFSRKEVGNDLFMMARLLEEVAYSRVFLAPGSLPTSIQAVLGVLLDFHRIERKKFFSHWPVPDSQQAS